MVINPRKPDRHGFDRDDFKFQKHETVHNFDGYGSGCDSLQFIEKPNGHPS